MKNSESKNRNNNTIKSFNEILDCYENDVERYKYKFDSKKPLFWPGFLIVTLMCILSAILYLLFHAGWILATGLLISISFLILFSRYLKKFSDYYSERYCKRIERTELVLNKCGVNSYQKIDVLIDICNNNLKEYEKTPLDNKYVRVGMKSVSALFITFTTLYLTHELTQDGNILDLLVILFFLFSFSIILLIFLMFAIDKLTSLLIHQKSIERMKTSLIGVKLNWCEIERNAKV